MAVLQPGTQLKRGTFVITSELGRGGFGEVYLARQPRMGRDVAVKVLLPRVAENPEVVARFEREALAAASLMHPHVLPVFDFDQDEETGVWFLAMQYVPGGHTLKERLVAPLPEIEAARILAAVASALDAAHARGIVHRDVKPANVLMDGERPLLTDFGIAHLGDLTGMTAAGIAIGTPAYMSPEQALGRTVGPRADQYSLGVMAYELLAGRTPFVGDALSLIHQQVNATPPPLGQFNPTLCAPARAAIMLALSKDPDDRFGTCGEFASVLFAACTAAPSAGPSVAPGASVGGLATSPPATPVSAPTAAATPLPQSATPPPGTAGGGVAAPEVPAPRPATPDYFLPATGSVVTPPPAAAPEPVAGAPPLARAAGRAAPSPPPESAPASAGAAPRSVVDELRARPRPAGRRAMPRGAVIGGILAMAALVLVGGAIGVGAVLRPPAEPTPERDPRSTPSPPGGGLAGAVMAPAVMTPSPPPSPPPAQGTIRVASVPDGAAILVNGEPAGRTPRALILAPGDYELSLAFPTYRDWTQPVQLAANETVTVTADLEAAPPSDVLTVSGTRIGKDAFLDGTGIIRLGTPTEEFSVADDLHAVVYLLPKTFDIRDVVTRWTFRWQRPGAPPIDLTGQTRIEKGWDEAYLHTCVPALSLDGRATNTPARVEALIDDVVVAQFTYRISGGNPASASPSRCDLTVPLPPGT